MDFRFISGDDRRLLLSPHHHHHPSSSSDSDPARYFTAQASSRAGFFGDPGTAAQEDRAREEMEVRLELRAMSGRRPLMNHATPPPRTAPVYTESMTDSFTSITPEARAPVPRQLDLRFGERRSLPLARYAEERFGPMYSGAVSGGYTSRPPEEARAPLAHHLDARFGERLPPQEAGLVERPSFPLAHHPEESNPYTPHPTEARAVPVPRQLDLRYGERVTLEEAGLSERPSLPLAHYPAKTVIREELFVPMYTEPVSDRYTPHPPEARAPVPRQLDPRFGERLPPQEAEFVERPSLPLARHPDNPVMSEKRFVPMYPEPVSDHYTSHPPEARAPVPRQLDPRFGERLPPEEAGFIERPSLPLARHPDNPVIREERFVPMYPKPESDRFTSHPPEARIGERLGSNPDSHNLDPRFGERHPLPLAHRPEDGFGGQPPLPGSVPVPPPLTHPPEAVFVDRPYFPLARHPEVGVAGRPPLPPFPNNMISEELFLPRLNPAKRMKLGPFSHREPCERECEAITVKLTEGMFSRRLSGAKREAITTVVAANDLHTGKPAIHSNKAREFGSKHLTAKGAPVKKTTTPGEHHQQPQLLYCGVCEVTCVGQSSLDSHLNGRKHKAQQQVLNSGVCKITCIGQGMLDSHLNGKKHKAKEECIDTGKLAGSSSSLVEDSDKAKEECLDTGKLAGGSTSLVEDCDKAKEVVEKSLEAKGAPIKEQQLWYCSVCKMTCFSLGMFNSHLNGKKHKARLREPLKDKQPKKLLYCSVCKMACVGSQGMLNHLIGWKHKAQLEELEKDKKP